ncbi:hypothetical protein FHW96_004796 [Novosphingobium sp. SG751A]|nr:hypothetical protein [Novosphingobium sp. SG751A]NOW48607.1 hypothetical protein [Novosphingobium sp. SG751A]
MGQHRAYLRHGGKNIFADTGNSYGVIATSNIDSGFCKKPVMGMVRQKLEKRLNDQIHFAIKKHLPSPRTGRHACDTRPGGAAQDLPDYIGQEDFSQMIGGYQSEGLLCLERFKAWPRRDNRQRIDQQGPQGRLKAAGKGRQQQSAALSNEKFIAEMFAQPRQRIADGGLGQGKPVGGARDAQFGHHHVEGA